MGVNEKFESPKTTINNSRVVMTANDIEWMRGEQKNEQEMISNMKVDEALEVRINKYIFGNQLAKADPKLAKVIMNYELGHIIMYLGYAYSKGNIRVLENESEMENIKINLFCE